jgi:hypothetical protein
VSQLDELLGKLDDRHRRALLWFAEHAGTVQPWPKALPLPDGETLLATKAKGIYKPAWSRYALSVRQTLDSPYADKEPVYRDDGTWQYQYFQENTDALALEEEFTNVGLLACWRDSVPVGVMRQVSRKPNASYKVLGLARVAGWDGGYFFFEGFAPNGAARERGPGGEIELLATEEEQVIIASGAFDPSNIIDGRQRVVGQILRRRGQPEFRQKLLLAYERRCAISACDAEQALEAAHIVPYRGPETNDVRNGLLMRADLHTLFDLGLIAVDVESMNVLLNSRLRATSYGELEGRRLRLPRNPSLWPSPEALKYHRDWSGL